MALELAALWPHQAEDVEAFFAAVEAGEKRICMTRPTGMGKSRTVQEIIFRYITVGRRAALYTNRRLLVDQLCRVMKEAGFEYGVRAAGFRRNDKALLQIAMVQTEVSRSFRVPKQVKEIEAKYEKGEMEPAEYFQALVALKARATEPIDAELAVVDEAHLFQGAEFASVIDHHTVNEAAILGVTATPIGLAPFYDVLIGNGNVSEGRNCGALVPAIHYACDEPDLAKLNIPLGVEISEKKATDAIMREGVIGRVLEWFEKLNPRHLPTILFAPSVGGSIFFAEEFTKAGIRAAHIDGEDVWLDGEFHSADHDTRRMVLRESKNGSIPVVCNRFVLREGIDMPWLRHCVFATVFGGLQSYLQSGGRVLRADRSEDSVARFGPKEFVKVQDHGGNWWRGPRSLNADRHWDLRLTSAQMTTIHQEKVLNGDAEEPWRCPGCGRVWGKLVKCECGYQFVKQAKRSRPVIQHDGKLVEVEGSTLKRRLILCKPNTKKLWEQTYWAAKKGKSGLTFMQAQAWFVQREHYWPPPDLPLMPLEAEDLIRRVRDVPPERLR